MLLQQLAVSLVLLLARARPAPVDEPVRVDLPVYDFPAYSLDDGKDNVAAGYAPGAAVEAPGAAVEARVGTNLGQKGSIVGNIITQKLNTATGAVSHKINILGAQKTALLSQVHAQSGIFSAPVSKLESAIQESESIGSKAKGFKENIQQIVAGLFQPQPIVDTISEAEKFGNEGDKFYGVGRAVVGGAEGVSNLVNSALEVPSAIFRKITRAASAKLNNLGGKLIGL